MAARQCLAWRLHLKPPPIWPLPPPHLPQSTHPHTHHPPPPSPPPQGICTLRYKGPKPIGYGLRAAVRDKYPDIIEVLMLDADTEEPIKF